jgi:hypothetical protein
MRQDFPLPVISTEPALCIFVQITKDFAHNSSLVEMPIAKVEDAARAVSSHSLRVGLTRDLLAAGEDGVSIAQALRWLSPSTALCYRRKLAVRSNVSAHVFSKIRSSTMTTA